jgi:hypothetical protein
MLRPSMQTLKHIVVNIHVDDDDVDPLFGIPSELEDMRTKNIIETVTIGILFRWMQDCRRGDDWGRLDEVLTAPGWFSLKRVSLAIELPSYNRSDDSWKWHCENCLRRNFRDFHQAIPFHSISRLLIYLSSLKRPLLSCSCLQLGNGVPHPDQSMSFFRQSIRLHLYPSSGFIMN